MWDSGMWDSGGNPARLYQAFFKEFYGAIASSKTN